MFCGSVSVLLLGGMVWIFHVGPAYDVRDVSVSQARVECQSLLEGWGAGLSGTPTVEELVERPLRGYEVVEGELPEAVGPPQYSEFRDDRIARKVEQLCQRGRSGQAGLMALLAVPATVTGAAALWRRKPAGP